ncbi:hypothetical protein HAX54_046770 [Datura stramonium]|uniref:Uncharacterized protein n=1 Tax=Datura stramonium TaxID=4076 RepID=A0ABS8WLA0_DATST|nr:hypothetical protein [Datura stramonium]
MFLSVVALSGALAGGILVLGESAKRDVKFPRNKMLLQNLGEEDDHGLQWAVRRQPFMRLVSALLLPFVVAAFWKQEGQVPSNKARIQQKLKNQSEQS